MQIFIFVLNIEKLFVENPHVYSLALSIKIEFQSIQNLIYITEVQNILVRAEFL